MVVTPTNVRTANGFAGLRVRSAGDVELKGTSWMFYGPAGSGKTTVAAMMAMSPLIKRLGLFDAEGGSSAVSHMGDALDIVDIKSWKDVEKLTQTYKNDPDSCPWDALAFDNISEYQPMHMKTLTNEQPTQPQWGENTRAMVDFVTTWRDASRLFGIHVAFCMWDAPEKDDFTGILKRDISMTPKLREVLPGKVDYVAYLSYIEGFPDWRVLSLEPSKRTVAKFRRPGHEAARTVPYNIPYRLDDPLMVDLLAALHGDTPFPRDKYPGPKKENKS